MEDHCLPDHVACKAAREVSSGLIHASLGGGVYKQRIARPGQGKSGGFRTILFFKMDGFAFLIMGFAKSDRENLTSHELKTVKDLAREMLSYDQKRIERAIEGGSLEELGCKESVS